MSWAGHLRRTLVKKLCITALISADICSRTIPGWKSKRCMERPEFTQRDSPVPKQLTRLITLCYSKNCAAWRTAGARFVCVIALVRDGTLVGTFGGEVEGRILDAPRGSGGFGYDPLFYYDPLACTFGEAALEEKMASATGRVRFKAMFTYLRGIVSS